MGKQAEDEEAEELRLLREIEVSYIVGFRASKTVGMRKGPGCGRVHGGGPFSLELLFSLRQVERTFMKRRPCQSMPQLIYKLRTERCSHS